LDSKIAPASGYPDDEEEATKAYILVVEEMTTIATKLYE
jgi:hypothetical protein